jgi:hypothetical protein
MSALRVIGTILIIIGILDFGLYYLIDLDFTGVWWSPYVFGTIGGLLTNAGKKQEAEQQCEECGEEYEYEDCECEEEYEMDEYEDEEYEEYEDEECEYDEEY